MRAKAKFILWAMFATGILIAASIVNVQVSEGFATSWIHYYAEYSYNLVYCVIQTRDGGFAVGGTGAGDACLVKTDSQGNMQWNHTYLAGSIQSIVQTSDEGYAILGGNFELRKTDPYGNVQWVRFFAQNQLGKSYSLIKTSDGGYAIAGGSSLVKTDALGNMQWNRTYGGGSVRSVVQTSDGGYALAGSTENTYWHWSMFWLVKTDSSGEMQWNKAYGRGKEALSLIQTKDGGYALTGTCFLLFKINSDGEEEWYKIYGAEGRTNYAYSIVQTNDGGYALGGYGCPETWALQLFKINATGNLEWNRNFRIEDATPDLECARAIQTEDGGFAVAGTAVRVKFSGYEFLLIKTDENGEVDTTSPSVSISSPLSETVLKSAIVEVTWSGQDEGSGIDRYEVKMDGGSWVNTGLNTTYTFNKISDGNHTAFVKVTDNVDLSTEVSTSFTVNTSLIGGPEWIDDIAVVTAVIIVVGVFGIYLWRAKKAKHSKLP